MSGKISQARWQKTKEKERQIADKASPMLTFCLFDDINVRQTMFDSGGCFHRELMQSVGRIGLIPFNAPLNGRVVEFERVLKGVSNYLLLHSEYTFEISKKEKEDFSRKIKYVRQQKRSLSIYATPIVAKVMKGEFHFTTIKEVGEISKKIRRSI